jgi:hypothetical protein
MRTLVMLVGSVLLTTACGSGKPLIRDYGSSYHGAFAAQAARGGKAPAQAVTGLDSQEAAITSDNYRGGLAPKGKEVREEPTIIVAPPSRERPMQLAPSVPKE